MIIRTEEQRAIAIEAGKRLGEVLEELAAMSRPGVSVAELDEYAEKRIRERGDIPCFLGYSPGGAHRPFPATLCVSVNDEVVHGIPTENPLTLQEGDIVSLDLGLTHKGIVMDSALTVGVGVVNDESIRLMRATEESLAAAIAAAHVGGRIGDISAAAGKVLADSGFSVVKELGGHGVGDEVHEEPFIANYGHPGTGPEIKEGMVLALEPIATAGRGHVKIAKDGYTFISKDGSRASHHEHTILIESTGTTVLTKRPSES